MIETIATGSPNVLGLKLHGTLHDEDYKQFVPAMETILTAEGKVRLFVEFEEDFHGWDLQAAWDDFKFGLKHYSDFERIAMVGNRDWERWMAAFCKPFTAAKVMYFDKKDVEAAWDWLVETKEDILKVDENSTKTGDTTSDLPPQVTRDNPGIWYGL